MSNNYEVRRDAFQKLRSSLEKKGMSSKQAAKMMEKVAKKSEGSNE